MPVPPPPPSLPLVPHSHTLDFRRWRWLARRFVHFELPNAPPLFVHDEQRRPRARLVGDFASSPAPVAGPSNSSVAVISQLRRRWADDGSFHSTHTSYHLKPVGGFVVVVNPEQNKLQKSSLISSRSGREKPEIEKGILVLRDSA